MAERIGFTQSQVDAGGFSVRYWEAGQGRPVVVLDSAGWRESPLHGALAEKYRVIFVELPGFGGSLANTRSQSAGDLAAAIAEAADLLTDEKYTLIGASFGGHVAIWQALQAPGRVEALILISPTAIKPQDISLETTPEEFHMLLFAHPANAANLPPVSEDVSLKEWELAQRLGFGRHDQAAQERLGEIRCPTLALFGSRDRLVSPEAARVYRENIPNCNISIVYDAGHCIIADRPEALVNAVDDYAQQWETYIVGRRTGLINP
ncbi:MAG: alpha/beta hydrolase [Chloroflexi bacterium]|nr:alpha/beta hydrolase [Chloroflexota bacterium]MDA1272079.1 alpha/beta hydrolase [Chloroflexota bacterium]